MTESEHIDYRMDGETAAAVTAYPIRDLPRDSAAVHTFYRDARSRLVPGMSMSGEAGPGVFGDRMALTSFTFSREHIPLPMEEIIDWLRDHPLVRVIEIERFGNSNRPPNER